MSTYVFMRILESAPARYDKGISILTLGRVNGVYDRLVAPIEKGQRVLDIGCGTGALTWRAALKGAQVKGIDLDAQMLEIAQKRAMEKNLSQNIELCEMGVAELCNEETESYDAIMSSLCFSELSDDEIRYTLKEVARILKPSGFLLIADETRANNLSKRLLNWLIEIPLVIITYIMTQTTTRAVKNLPEKIKNAGLQIKSIRLSKMESFIELVASKPDEDKQ